MNFLADRLPSKEQVYLLFLAIIFPVNFWAFLFFLQELPAYLLRLNGWDIIGILAYELTIALLDCLLLFGVTILIGLFFPRRVIKDHYVGISILLAYSIFLWVIPIHFRGFFLDMFPFLQSTWALWLWTVTAILLFSLLSFLLLRYKTFEEGLYSFLDRLSVVSTFYLVMNGFGLLITIGRNAGSR